MFSPDHRLMACVPEGESKQPVPVKFFDMKTGKLHCQFQSSTWALGNFSPDGRYFLLPSRPRQGLFQLMCRDAPGRRPLWERTWDDGFGCAFLFTPDSQSVIATFLSRVEFLDAATGDTRRTISLPSAYQLQPSLTADGRTLEVKESAMPILWPALMDWVSANGGRDWVDRPSTLHFYDMETGQELGHLQQAPRAQAELAPDRRSLVTSHHQYQLLNDGMPINTIVQCWDLPPRRSLWWPVAVPLAIGLLAVSVAWWKRRRARSHNRANGPSPDLAK